MAAVVRERPEWAVARRMLPVDHAALLEALADPDEARRFRGLNRMGLVYALLGVHEEQVEFDGAAARLRPGAKAPLRRLVFGQLRRQRAREALAAAERLIALGADDPRSAPFVAVAATPTPWCRCFL